MIAAVEHASHYDWATWVLGIMRSFLSGGAAALVTGGGGLIAGITMKQHFIMMGSSFLLMGLYRMGEFLQLHGAPDPVAAQAALEKAAVATKEVQGAIAEAKAVIPPADK